MIASSIRVTEALCSGSSAAVLSALILGAAITFVPLHARAQTDLTSARQADELFAQGKASLAANDFAHACPKLAESYALDPAAGTLLALAICHEGLGRTGTAWREFRSVAEGALRDGRADRARFAREHIVKIEPKLSRLTVLVPGAAPGLEVEVDGVPLAQDDWGKAMPIDSGHHTIAARAPGRKPGTFAVDVGLERDTQAIEIALGTPEISAPASVAAPATTQSVGATTAPASGARDWRRPTGWVVGGIGLAAISVGAIFGVSAIAKSSDVKSKCSPSLCTDAATVRENGDAKTAATVSNVSIGAGAAIVAVGAYLLLTAPMATPPSSAFRWVPIVGRQQVGAAFEEEW
ncbi:MAG TPA: hypothetical protein VGI39_43790 [Polyangiaceae bacterium]